MQEGVSQVKPTQIYGTKPFKGLAIEMTDSKLHWLPLLTRLPFAAPKPTASFLILSCGNIQLPKTVVPFYVWNLLGLLGQHVFHRLTCKYGHERGEISLPASTPKVRALLTE